MFIVPEVTNRSRNRAQVQLISCKSQCSRDTRVGALFRKLATWEDSKLVSPKPSPSCQLEGKGFYREKPGSFRGVQVRAMCRTAQTAPIIISKRFMRWSGRNHLVLSTVNLQLQGRFGSTSLRRISRSMQVIDSVLPKMEQLVSRLRSGHHAVSFFPLLVVLVSAKQLRNVHQTLLSMSFREELKIL